jgi:microcystin-dependent protein
LSLDQFKPITVMWEVMEQLNDVTDYKKANEQLKKYSDETTNRQKIEASVSAGYGPFSAKVGYEKEMTQKNVNEGYFKTQDEYKTFRSKNSTSKGLRPIITPRGLNLIEKTQFESRLGLATASVAYYPVDQIKTILIRATGLQKDYESKNFPNGLFERVPVGVITCFAGPHPPEGWLPCGGQEYNLSLHPELLPLANVLGDKYFDRMQKKLRMPDLRGRVSVGAGKGDGLSMRTLGDKGGEESHTLTVNEIPAHGHDVDASVAKNQGRGKYGLSTKTGEFEDRVLISGGAERKAIPAGGSQAHNIMPVLLDGQAGFTADIPDGECLE